MLSLKLRAATRPAHEALEAAPFSRRLGDGSLDLRSYARYLAAMWHFHSAVEEAAASADDAAVRAVWHEDMRRASSIEGDLRALGHENAAGGAVVDPFPALLDGVDDDRQLIGLLYVSEGSRLGGRVLRKSLLHYHPGLVDGGLAYLDGHGERTGQYWAGFRARLDGLVLGSDGERAVVEGADTGFRAVQKAFAAL